MSARSDEDYLAGRIQDALARDPMLGTQDLVVRVRGGCVSVEGQASTDERRARIVALIADLAPGLEVCDELVVLEVEGPCAAEVLDA